MTFNGTKSKWQRLISFIVLAIGLIGLFGQPPAAQAGYAFTVDYTGDTDDTVTGNGYCEDFFGRCSLRAAIQETNTQPGQDTIIIETGIYILTQTGVGEDNADTGDLDITDDLIIQGQGGVFIDGDDIDRVFHILGAGTTVEMSDITIRNGKAPDSSAGTSSDGGGIYNGGSLTTQNVTVAYNDAGSGGFTGGFGGGIYSLGALTLNNSHIMSNNGGDGASGATPTDGGGGGGVYVWGSTVSITNSTIAYNSSGDGGDGSSGQSGRQSGYGGGIYLADNTVATITDSTIQGNTTGAGGTGDNLGGSSGNGGGIYFIGNSLDLTRVFISGNVTGSGGIGSSGNGSGGGCGGLAIFYARGAVSIAQTVIEGNQTGNGRNGGVGGGLCYIDPISDALSITDSDIVDNRTGYSTVVDGEGGDGGGLYIDNTANYIPSAIVTLTNTELAGNVTGYSGTGGSYVYGGHGGGIYSSDATLTVNSSTIAQNQTGTGRYGGYGGGIYHFSGSLTVNSSTISGNQLGTGSTVGGDGGGIYAGGTTHLNHSVISNNAASQSGGGIRAVGTTNLMNSILANNTASVSGPDCNGGINSLGYNLVEDVSDCTISGDTENNIMGEDPLLGSLQDNGGPTRTRALTPNSPAIDEGHPTQCPATDQRGKDRPANQCDIGPFEIQDVESTTNSSWSEDTAVSFGATMVTITRTLGSTSPLTTTVTKEGVPPGGGSPDAGEMSVTWTIDAEVDTGLNLDLAFCYTDSELGALNEPDLSAYRYDGTDWQLMGGAVDESSNCVHISGVTALSDWTLATAIPTMPEAITGLSAASDSPTLLDETTTFTATVSTGSNVVYTWAFGDGDTGNGAVETHTYPSVGVYTATVTATNSIGVVVATTTVTVDEAIAGLAATNDSPTTLGDATTLTAGSNVAYTWAFGDGDTGSGAVVNYTYPAADIYTATVTATNSVGVVVATTTVTVDKAIAGLAAVNDGPTALGDVTTLTATITAGSNVAYTWAFGDGDAGSGAVVNHTYPAADIYTATVTATNSVGVVVATTTVTVDEAHFYIYLPLVLCNLP